MGDPQMMAIRDGIEMLIESSRKNKTKIERESPLVDIDPEEVLEIEKLVRDSLITNLGAMELEGVVESDPAFVESMVNLKMNNMLRGDDLVTLEYYRKEIRATKK